MDETVTLPRLMTPANVAEYLGVSVETLTQWRYNGRGPRFTKVGKFVRYAVSDVAEFLDAQRWQRTDGKK